MKPEPDLSIPGLERPPYPVGHPQYLVPIFHWIIPGETGEELGERRRVFTLAAKRLALKDTGRELSDSEFWFGVLSELHLAQLDLDLFEWCVEWLWESPPVSPE